MKSISFLSRLAISLRGPRGRPAKTQFAAPGPREKRPVVYVQTGTPSIGPRPHCMLEVFAKFGHATYLVDQGREPGGLGVPRSQIVTSLEDTPSAPVILYLHNGSSERIVNAYEDPLVIYDIIDESTMLDFDEQLPSRNNKVPPSDIHLVKAADVVIAANERLADQKWLSRPDLLVVPNGIFVGKLEGPAARPRDLPSDSPLIGSWAPVSPLLNLELIEMVAHRRPEWNFALVGPIDQRVRARAARLGSLPNVLMLGPRDAEMRRSYLQAFDVGAIWSVVNELTSTSTPLRMYEYLAVGKPCVSTQLPACSAEPEVTTANEPAAFIEAIEKALVANSPAEVEARLEAGRRADWSQRLRPVFDLLESAHKLKII